MQYWWILIVPPSVLRQYITELLFYATVSAISSVFCTSDLPLFCKSRIITCICALPYHTNMGIHSKMNAIFFQLYSPCENNSRSKTKSRKYADCVPPNVVSVLLYRILRAVLAIKHNSIRMHGRLALSLCASSPRVWLTCDFRTIIIFTITAIWPDRDWWSGFMWASSFTSRARSTIRYYYWAVTKPLH